jgi:hypothetical protein
MTTQGGLQRRQQRQTLFAQRGHIAANASKGLSTCSVYLCELYTRAILLSKQSCCSLFLLAQILVLPLDFSQFPDYTYDQVINMTNSVYLVIRSNREDD